jgi:hypothetical protein
LDIGSQCCSGLHVSLDATHWTHAPEAVSHTAPPGWPAQSASPVQRSVQVRDVGLQMVPAMPAQSVCERHVAEQSPLIGSHTAPAGLPVQSTLDRHGATHAPVIGLQVVPLGWSTQSASPAQRLVHMRVVGWQMSPAPWPVQSRWAPQRMVQRPVPVSQMLPVGLPAQSALPAHGD